MKITYLNTFAGIGGNTKNLDRNKFEITHVENNKKRLNYLEDNFKNDIIINADAYEFILDNINNYDILWASPPCPTHSSIRWLSVGSDNFKYVYPDMQMYGLIILLQRGRKKDWIVENVTPYYEPLITQTAKVGRHLIWSNRHISNKNFPADNIRNMKADPIRKLSVKDLRDEMNPNIGKYIIDQILIRKVSLEDYV